MILVTGGTGLVGSHLLFQLVKDGQQVRALRRANSCIDELKKVFEFYQEDSSDLFQKIEWFEGDLLNYFSLKDALLGVSKVYHCAAMVSFKPSDAMEMFSTNVEGTANLVNACIELNVPRFCFVSSIATLGKPLEGEVIDESTFWQNDDNHSVYSQSKFRAEMEVWRGTKEGLNAVVVNPSVILGPVGLERSTGQLFKSVMNGVRFYTAGATGFVGVRDVVKVMIALANSDVVNERYVINAENIAYKKFMAMAAGALNVKAPKVKAVRWMVSLAWRIERLRYYITRKEPRLTKETARTSQHKSFYSDAKLQAYMPFKYISIQDSIENTAKYLKE
ncbi:NAD-dependent epimerase/dehydratase family protein [Carboxylicivirga sp. N1Y90]|uniref:NAD-dependent epimerase/dehydratase family protein n=1 Tax=Carboxylicivirga fragile TaxID=3417571 RepID=UPI003D33475C|nr:NAD-dependent epimerase/dehydratase family protein [Marinilabiliaceae bacterium N1Y90]